MDLATLLRQIQLEKTIGELNALKASYYDTMGTGHGKFMEVKDLIDKIIKDLYNSI